jgi:penicillin-binding protein 2
MSFDDEPGRWLFQDPTPAAVAAAGVRRKIFYLGLIVFLVFGIMAVQLARMQLLNGAEYRLRADNNRLRQVTVVPDRGLIFDRNGLPLVENRASFAAAVVPADLPKSEETRVLTTLQDIIGVPAGELQAKLEERRNSNDPFSPVVVREDLPQETAFLLREKLASLPGVRVIVDARRQYTEGTLLAHVLGFVGRVDEEEYAALRTSGYKPDDQIGKTGVELYYERLLRGTAGRKNVEMDASGREIRVLGATPATPGDNLVLSIDVELQRRVTEYLQAAMGRSRNAAAVVLNVRTGEILSLVSLPSFDNNIFTGKVDEARVRALLEDPGKPLVNHAVSEMYPPGSTFKQVTGTAALQEGIAHAGTRITSLGYIQVKNEYNPSIVYTFRDWAALGTLDFHRGVAMSSDVYFYYLAGGYVEDGREVFRGMGAATLAKWARRFGLGSPTGVDIVGPGSESAGIVPDPDWKMAAIGEPWVIGDTYNYGIGQGYVATTPLQMVLVTAAIANGGDVLVPRVVKEVVSADGKTVTPVPRTVKSNLNVDPRNLAVMRQGMRLAVSEGTARTAASRFTNVAGKTGTAEFGEEIGERRFLEHGWFTGYAPYENPEIAVVVFLEQGNGATTAAPVAAKIFDYYFGARPAAEGRPR